MQEIKRQLVSEAEYFLSVLSGRIFWDDRNNPYLHCPTQWQLSPTTDGSLTQIRLCSHVWQTGTLVLNESGQNLPTSWEFPVLLVESKSSSRGPSEVWTAFATHKEHMECYSVNWRCTWGAHCFQRSLYKWLWGARSISTLWPPEPLSIINWQPGHGQEAKDGQALIESKRSNWIKVQHPERSGVRASSQGLRSRRYCQHASKTAPPFPFTAAPSPGGRDIWSWVLTHLQPLLLRHRLRWGSAYVTPESTVVFCATCVSTELFILIMSHFHFYPGIIFMGKIWTLTYKLITHKYLYFYNSSLYNVFLFIY